MLATQKMLFDEPITPKEWAWVQSLIQDVAQEEAQEADFLITLGAWKAVLTAFKKYELRLIQANESRPEVLDIHQACLHGLLAIGKALRSRAHNADPDLFANMRFTPEVIDACIRDLEDSVTDQLHHFSASEIKALEEKIFSGTA